MTSLIASMYVLAAVASLLALTLRADPGILASLGSGARTPRRDLLSRLGRRLRMPRSRTRVVELLRTLGRNDADRVMGGRLALAAGGVFAGIATASGPGALVLRGLLLGAAGWTLPVFLLAREARARRERIRGQVPDLLDTLAICVTAGLTPRLGLARSTAIVSDPLGVELAAAARDVSLGSPWRSAMRSLAERTGLEELRQLCAVLERSERLGSPAGARLRGFAAEVRRRRRAEQEERAGRAPVLMLLPLVLCILPAFVVAAVIPAVLAAARGLQ